MVEHNKNFLDLPKIALAPENLNVLFSAKEFHAYLINAIENATSRIYMAALYLEDDEAGRGILEKLYQAKQQNPLLDIVICVDWHRAQRGLIGSKNTEGNAKMYSEFAQAHQHKIQIIGIPVRSKEVFGVLHLKGFIIDDEVIYSGASLNNTYLHCQQRYRLDRYHSLKSKPLADSMVNYITEYFVENPATFSLSSKTRPKMKALRPLIKQFRMTLSQSEYYFDSQQVDKDQIAVTPLVGIGRRHNKLNSTIIQLIAIAKKEIKICTPYFNFPPPLLKAIRQAMKRGVQVKIFVGDKTASDFYIPSDNEFHTIAGVPFIYEINLRHFVIKNQSFMNDDLLAIHLWKHGSNSYHLKGIWIDMEYVMLTGNNLNPRAWKLDLENAILIHDPYHHLTHTFQQEIHSILNHTDLITDSSQIETMEDYRPEAQRLLKRIRRFKADMLINQIM